MIADSLKEKASNIIKSSNFAPKEVLIERGIRVIIPNGNTVVKTGDRLVLYSQSEKPEK